MHQHSNARAVLKQTLRALEVVSAILLFVMMVLTFADVIGRYVFTAPIYGAAEMVQFLLAMTIFAGLGLVNAHDQHIVVELFEPALDRYFARTRRVIVQLFSVMVMAIIAFELTNFAIEAQQQEKATVVLEWPLVVVAGTVAFFSALSLVLQIAGLLIGEETSAADHQGGAL